MAADAASDYVETAVLTTYLVTNPCYVALYSADPTDTGTAATEVTGGSYVRKQATFTVTGSTATLSADIVWSGMPAVTVAYIGIWDAAANGHLLFRGALTASKAVAAGDAFALPSGNVTISMD